VNAHPRELHTFALGGLTGAAEAAVSQHVATCRRCRHEVRRLREDYAATVDALPPLSPSPAARDSALAAARAAMVGTATDATTSSAAPWRVRPSRRQGRRWAPLWLGWSLAGVLAIAAVGLSWERHTAWRASEADRALVAGWLTRTDVTTWPLPAAPGARSPGSVMVADDGVVLVVMRAPAPGGAAYRAWGIGPDGATALGDVPRTVLRAPAAGYDEVLVSLEPGRAGGAPTQPLGAAPVTRGRPPP
jgi:anti-sigma factor RsiW